MLDRQKPATTLLPTDYREAMSRFAGAVSVVTTDGPRGRRGVTVSAAVSVSDNPPTLLICLNRNRDENRWFGDNGHFALNVLTGAQTPLARAFAGEGHLPMEARFSLGQWSTLQTGAPVLDGARMALDCIVKDVQSVHTHYVIIGEAVACRMEPIGGALIYVDREYREL